jgi:hypothetical protein
VHFFASQEVADHTVAHAIHRAEVAAAQTLANLVAAFDKVVATMLKKP